MYLIEVTIERQDANGIECPAVFYVCETEDGGECFGDRVNALKLTEQQAIIKAAFWQAGMDEAHKNWKNPYRFTVKCANI